VGQAEFSTALADFNQNQLDQIETSTATIDTAVGRVETAVNDIKNTDLSNVSTRLGSDADAASSTGSVHSKLKEMRTLVDTLETEVGKIPKSAPGLGDFRFASASSPDSATTVDIVNVAGKGMLHSVWAKYWEQYANSNITVIIDGVTKLNKYQFSVGSGISPHNMMMNARFNTSLRVQITSSHSTADAFGACQYSLD
jgi:hypothetical protein